MDEQRVSSGTAAASPGGTTGVGDPTVGATTLSDPTVGAATVGGPAVAEAPAPRKRRLRRPRRWFRYTLPGMWGALILGCLSFTPSLLPRSGITQGLVTGIAAATGYGLGVVAAYVWRLFADRPERPARRRSWRVFTVVAIVAGVVAIVFGQYWQAEIRHLMGAAPPGILSYFLFPVVVLAIFAFLVAIGRFLRWLFHLLERLLSKVFGRRAARAVGWVAVALGTWLVVSGVLIDGFMNAANQSFKVQNDVTQPGVTQPTTGLRSGGPGSLVSWDSLGREGRRLMSEGPTESDIASFTGQSAKAPIRAYAGIESAASTEGRAALAVDDLARAGGFDRANLLVVSTTGSGWADPGNIAAFEYMSGGDSAVIGIQYSYLPSWISFLVDQKQARAAGRDLYDAVYERISQLPDGHRPKVFVAGESLGSFGAEAAFSGEFDLRNRTSGTLLTGPPSFNTLHTEFTDGRDQGSPQILPVYRDGRTVRFTTNATDIPPTDKSWNGTRVLYIQHSSDPIVWWSPQLVFHEPDWLKEKRGPDVLPAVHWFPILTFWQVTLDLPFATGVPSGHGHVYTREAIQGWATVMQPPGWTDDEVHQLQDKLQNANELPG